MSCRLGQIVQGQTGIVIPNKIRDFSLIQIIFPGSIVG